MNKPKHDKIQILIDNCYKWMYELIISSYPSFNHMKKGIYMA